MIGKVYSRKKATFPQLIQVQGSEPTFGNEVTISHPPLQTKLEFQSKKTHKSKPSYCHQEGNKEMY